jgi:hypothetical protein
MFEYVAIGGIVLLAMVIMNAVFFEAGRASFKKEMAASWRASRCRECGAAPEPRIRHVSGCGSGWPDPGRLFDGDGG